MEIPNLATIHAKDIDRIAKEQAKIFVLQDRLKTHQLRNVFSAIERMRSKTKAKPGKDQTIYQMVETDLILLKPKIAYAAGRQKSVRNTFFPFVEAAIEAVVMNQENEKKVAALKNFFALMESVVGYHKFFESGQN
ncbi:MAG: type III-A CRISPR-associated protein Csm2 [Haliscomenobacter sp.]|nr:type III-A CRISPR-associated protein Csm2 [Haliscomenobacter sp.]